MVFVTGSMPVNFDNRLILLYFLFFFTFIVSTNVVASYKSQPYMRTNRVWTFHMIGGTRDMKASMLCLNNELFNQLSIYIWKYRVK